MLQDYLDRTKAGAAGKHTLHLLEEAPSWRARYPQPGLDAANLSSAADPQGVADLGEQCDLFARGAGRGFDTLGTTLGKLVERQDDDEVDGCRDGHEVEKRSQEHADAEVRADQLERPDIVQVRLAGDGGDERLNSPGLIKPSRRPLTTAPKALSMRVNLFQIGETTHSQVPRDGSGKRSIAGRSHDEADVGRPGGRPLPDQRALRGWDATGPRR